MKHSFSGILVLSAAVLAGACNRAQKPSAPPSVHAEAAPPAIVYQDHIWAGDVAPPGGTLSNPDAGDAHSAKDGEQLYTSMNCDGCHGGEGSGWVGPSLADGRWRYGGGDAEIFNSIFYGRPKGMPAYGGLVGRDGAWRLVSYLKSLPKPDVVPTESWIEPQGETAAAPAPSAQTMGEPTGGVLSELETSMQQDGCSACHAVDRHVVGPSFKAVAVRYHAQGGAEQKLVGSAKNGSTGVWGTIPMPANRAVGDEELHRIVRRILSLQQ